jgi:hypothetical protein
MADFTLTVSVSNDALVVSTPSLQVPHGAVKSVEWTPGSGSVTIKFIGFYQPTAGSVPSGTGPVATPEPTTGGAWGCEVDNEYSHSFTDYFFYTVFAEVDGVMLCTDPEIQNEPPSG